MLCNKRSHFFLGMCWSPVCPGPQGWLRGLGKPNCQDSKQPPSHLGGWVPSRLWLLCPSGQCLEPTAPKRALGRQSRWPSLTCPSWPAGLGSCALACQYLLPPYVLSSGPAGLPPLPPGLVPPIPSRPSLDHPGQPWDQACTAGAVPSARGHTGPADFQGSCWKQGSTQMSVSTSCASYSFNRACPDR